MVDCAEEDEKVIQWNEVHCFTLVTCNLNGYNTERCRSESAHVAKIQT